MKSRSAQEPGFWYGLGAIAIIAGLALRLQLASVAETPGHGDSAFYYTVAKNIVDGRGIVIDYVVYFFLGLVPITHYAGDFWNPLAGILLSLPMLLLGKSVFNALLASIAAGLVPALVGFFAGRRFSSSVMVGVLVGVLTFFSPFQVLVSVLTEAIIFFGAFGSLALFLAMKGRSNPRYFLLAAVCTGLAQFVRQDGVLLLFTLLICVGIARLPWRQRLGLVAAALAVHALVISPVLVRNYLSYNSVLQPGPASTTFMTSYEDFHAYGKELSWDTLRAEWGVRGIVTRRLHTGGENLAQIKLFLHPLLLYLASLGLVNMVLTRQRVRDLHVLVPPLIFSVLVFGFYTVLASFSGPGSLPKSLAVVLPFICVLAVDLLVSRIRSLPLLVFTVCALAAFLGYRGYKQNYATAMIYNQVYGHYDSVRTLVEADARARGADPQSVVIMARDVWDVHEATGFKSVMIPNNDLETILFVADHYGADYMLLPAPRKALQDIYHGTTPDPRFVWLGSVEGTDWRVFRIQPQAP
ncbi:MAG: hypothetical protein V1755_14620 [Chloroflexota bacterium]